MSKKTNSAINLTPTDFSWGDDPPFTPPDNGVDITKNKFLVPEDSRVIDLKPVVEKLLATLVETVSASYGVARILPTYGQTHQLFNSFGLPDTLHKLGADLELNCENCAQVSLGNGIFFSNLSECKQRQDCLNVGCQIQSLITSPIESHNTPKDSIGTLILFFNEPKESLEATSKTVLAFTDLLSTLIEHNKLNREVRRIDLIAERQSIANEIHDSLAQSLVYTRMRTSLLLEAIQTQNELMITRYAHDIDDALTISQKTVRELITDFRCSLDPSGLLHALQTLIEQFRNRNDISLEYINRIAHIELPLEYEIQISHIVHEALANIAAHSEATHARLVVDFSSNYYVFTIEDNGSGGCTFSPVEGHYGMMIMRERAQRIGGEIRVDSTKGLGTSVQLFFPNPGLDWRAVNE